MFRDAMRRMASTLQLRRPMPMMRHRLHRLAVIGLEAIGRRRAIVEVIADAITREDLRRHQPRADLAAVIAQHKAIKAGFLRGPVFARRNEDRPTRRSGGSAKDK